MLNFVRLLTLDTGTKNTWNWFQDKFRDILNKEVQIDKEYNLWKREGERERERERQRERERESQKQKNRNSSFW